MRIHYKEYRLRRHQFLRGLFRNQQVLHTRCRAHLIHQLFDRILIFADDDMRRHAFRSRHVRDAQRRPERIVIFFRVPHDEHHVRLADQLVNRLRHHAGAHTRIFRQGLTLTAEGLRFTVRPNDDLIAAAAQCQIERQARFLFLLGEGFFPIGTTDRKRHRNPVHRVNRTHFFQYFEVIVNQSLQRLTADAGDIVIALVTLDKAVELTEFVEHDCIDFRPEFRTLHFRQIGRNFAQIVQLHVAENRQRRHAFLLTALRRRHIVKIQHHVGFGAILALRGIHAAGAVEEFINDTVVVVADPRGKITRFSPQFGQLRLRQQLLQTVALFQLLHPVAKHRVAPDEHAFFINNRDPDR